MNDFRIGPLNPAGRNDSSPNGPWGSEQGHVARTNPQFGGASGGQRPGRQPPKFTNNQQAGHVTPTTPQLTNQAPAPGYAGPLRVRNQQPPQQFGANPITPYTGVGQSNPLVDQYSQQGQRSGEILGLAAAGLLGYAYTHRQQGPAAPDTLKTDDPAAYRRRVANTWLVFAGIFAFLGFISVFETSRLFDSLALSCTSLAT